MAPAGAVTSDGSDAEPAEITPDSSGVSHDLRGPSDVTAVLELFDRRYREVRGKPFGIQLVVHRGQPTIFGCLEGGPAHVMRRREAGLLVREVVAPTGAESGPGPAPRRAHDREGDQIRCG